MTKKNCAKITGRLYRSIFVSSISRHDEVGLHECTHVVANCDDTSHFHYIIIVCFSATKETVSIEDLVDDFASFYIAGKHIASLTRLSSSFTFVFYYHPIYVTSILSLLGQETTGNLLAFAVAQLHLHPDILAR